VRIAHRMPFGAEPTAAGSTRFALWAPAARSVSLLLETAEGKREAPLEPAPHGWFVAEVDDAGAGSRYRFRIDGGRCVPDPASRFQPDGVHGASEVIDPRAHAWTDEAWRGRPWHEVVLYELHVGTFSARGDYAGVAERLAHLTELGVTAVELMPLAECPGARNWGYDGVFPFAPESRYGRPEDLKRLVESAHQNGLMVFVDVVYNHFGPEGNLLGGYAPDFFTRRYRTPWGAAIDFEGPRSRSVRDFFIHNALYWLEEYRVDGLRLDAVHAIHDGSGPDFLTELAETVRARVGGQRRVHLVLENDRNEARRLGRDGEGNPRLYTAQWNDDAHHALHVLLTGERDGYYGDYADRPIAHLGRSLAEGFVYQGEPSPFRGGDPRGECSRALPPTAFVAFLQNHDQVGNRAFGDRLAALAEPEAIRAGTAVLLLAPWIPLLFMGEEWATARRFPFFCDFGPELAASVREGRRREFARFAEFRDPAARERIPDPGAVETFEAAVLPWEERETRPHREHWALCRRLLDVRRRELVPRLAGMPGGAADFETIGDRALRVRWRLGDGSRLLLLAHLGRGESRVPAPPPAEGRVLFAVPEAVSASLARGALGPWSVAWLLAPPAEDA
jgi:maltooligosyltrehalose trehalohydrolase